MVIPNPNLARVLTRCYCFAPLSPLPSFLILEELLGKFLQIWPKENHNWQGWLAFIRYVI